MRGGPDQPPVAVEAVYGCVDEAVIWIYALVAVNGVVFVEHPFPSKSNGRLLYLPTSDLAVTLVLLAVGMRQHVIRQRPEEEAHGAGGHEYCVYCTRPVLPRAGDDDQLIRSRQNAEAQEERHE